MKTEMKQTLRQIVREALELARRGEHPRVADITARSYLRGPWLTEAAEIAAYLIDDVEDGPVTARCVEPGCKCLDRAGVTYASRAEVQRGYEID